MQSNARRQLISPDRLQEGLKQMCPFIAISFYLGPSPVSSQLLLDDIRLDATA